MKTLIIDSHKGLPHEEATNLHVRNAREIAKFLDATLIASHHGADEIAQQKWDAIIFNHASGYSNVDYKCIEMNPDAKLFYITNEYNLGEPNMLWMAAKAGRSYDVIANHSPVASKVVKKYVGTWNIINLNSIIFNADIPEEDLGLFEMEATGTTYYGSFRKNRQKYFQKYFDKRLSVSTSRDNVLKFAEAIPNLQCRFINKLQWRPYPQLRSFKYSLYIEDEKTHTHYNYLANRFYEAISCGVTPVFDESCEGTVHKSGYDISRDFFCSNADELHSKDGLRFNTAWLDAAAEEKQQTLQRIKSIISGQ